MGFFFPPLMNRCCRHWKPRCKKPRESYITTQRHRLPPQSMICSFPRNLKTKEKIVWTVSHRPWIRVSLGATREAWEFGAPGTSGRHRGVGLTGHRGVGRGGGGGWVRPCGRVPHLEQWSPTLCTNTAVKRCPGPVFTESQHQLDRDTLIILLILYV